MVVGDRVVRVEQAALRQNAAERAADRFADGEHDMRRGGAHAGAVPLRGDASAPEHDERIGIGRAQRVAERGGLAVMAAKTNLTDVLKAGFERNGIAGGRDIGGGNQLPDIAKTPGAERRLAPVRKLTRASGEGGKSRIRCSQPWFLRSIIRSLLSKHEPGGREPRHILAATGRGGCRDKRIGWNLKVWRLCHNEDIRRSGNAAKQPN